MDCSMGAITIPAATISSVDTFAVLIGVVLYDVILAPLMIRLGRPITILQRIGIGYCFAALAMVVAAGVELRRLQLIQQQGIADNPDAIVNMSWAWQIPQYTLVGFSEVFSNIGAMQVRLAGTPHPLDISRRQPRLFLYYPVHPSLLCAGKPTLPPLSAAFL